MLLTAFEKRAMEAELKENGVPKKLLVMITAITGQHYQAALERRKNPLIRLVEKMVTA